MDVLENWEWFAAAAFVGLIVYVFWQSHNRLTALDQRCAAAFGDVDVLLTERHTLIPPLVETVRGMVGHENKTLTEVTQARSNALGARGEAERLQAENEVGRTMFSLLAVAEQYPEIAASRHFQQLQNELSRVEDRIAAARRFYNLAVSEFNTTKDQFPGNITASFAKIAPREVYSLGGHREEYDRRVQVSF
jgi:LemA protein